MKIFLNFLFLFSLFVKIFGQDCATSVGLNSVMYVSPSGTGSCSMSSPCSLVQALANLNAGSSQNVIWLQQGTYDLVPTSPQFVNNYISISANSKNFEKNY